LQLQTNTIEEGLNFILGHFQEPIWPRTISTKTTEGRQIVVFNKQEANARFKQANGLDCRINAYPNYIGWKGTNRQAPNFIFIDLDSRDGIDLLQFIGNICGKFEDYSIQPTVLESGRGYHFYLPVRAFVLESEELFQDFGQPSRGFIQWAEQHLSDGKADKCHSMGLSFKNCMLRIPGSINSKLDKEVSLAQRWNGRRPSIRPLLEEFYVDITEDKIKEIQGIKVKCPPAFYHYWRNTK
jgi:hypothetical protein